MEIVGEIPVVEVSQKKTLQAGANAGGSLECKRKFTSKIKQHLNVKRGNANHKKTSLQL